jgi:hypothetical protein
MTKKAEQVPQQPPQHPPHRRPLVGAQLLEVGPRHEDDRSRAERQQQYQAEVVLCPLPRLVLVAPIDVGPGS